MKFSTVRLSVRALRAAVAERAAYRGDFILSFLVSFLLELVTPAVTVLIYAGGTSFPGWTMREALLIQAVFLLAKGIAFPLFFGIVWVVLDQVRDGTFETILLKPRSPLFLTLLRGVDPEGTSRFAGGILLLSLTSGGLGIPGGARWAYFGLLLAISVLIQFAFALMLASSLFVWIGNGRLFELLESVFVFARYPGSIYPAGLRVVFAVVLPVSMIALFPAEALLGRISMFHFISIPAGIVFFLVGLSFWRFMIRRYAGGGG